MHTMIFWLRGWVLVCGSQNHCHGIDKEETRQNRFIGGRWCKLLRDQLNQLTRANIWEACRVTLQWYQTL